MNNETKITTTPGGQSVTITREFDAPRELVFRAYAVPELLAQWLGPKDVKMTIEKYEFRDGGSYRYIHSRGETDYCFRGVFHEVLAPERVIQTFEYEGLSEKGHVSLGSMTLEALPGNRTKLVIHSVFQTTTDLNGMLQSGMERGINEGYEKLDELLAKQTK